MADGCRSAEKDYFFGKLAEYAARVQAMPKTYETDGQGDSAVAHLHYFSGSSDFYITERDAGHHEDPVQGVQHQAFGLVRLNGCEPELGYIGIGELIHLGVELDLHWQPKTLREIKEGK